MNRRKQPLTIDQILTWADEHYRRTGKYPSADSGPLSDDRSLTWKSIDQALALGVRGLPGNDTLALLLMRERGHRHLRLLPKLTEEMIVSWVKGHQTRTGEWPSRYSGPVVDAPGEVWANIDQALRRGSRGLPGGDSLPRLLARTLGVTCPAPRPSALSAGSGTELSQELILQWAAAYRAAKSRWPVVTSPPVGLPPGESWLTIDRALRQGHRGLPGGSSLARLLMGHCLAVEPFWHSRC